MKVLFIRVFLVLVILANYYTSKAQQINVDSLNILLDQEKNLKLKIDKLNLYSDLLHRNNPTQALEYAHKALVLAKKEKDNKSLYMAYKNIANVHWVFSDYQEGMAYLYEALDIAESMEDKSLLIPVLTQLADINLESNQPEKAFEHLNRAIQIAGEINDTKSSIMLYSNLGEYYITQKDYPNALNYTQKALWLSNKANDNYYFAMTNMNLAMIHNEQKNFKEALPYASKAYTLFERSSHLLTSVSCLVELGRCYIGLKDYHSAGQQLNTALNIAKKVRAKKEITSIYLYLSQNEEEQNNLNKALEYHKLYKTYADSVYNEEKSRQMAMLQTLKDIEKKDLEITALTRDKKLNEGQIQTQKNLRNTFIAAFLFFVVIALALYFNNRIKQKANIQLKAQYEEIQSKNEEILATQKEIEKKNRLLELQNYEINLKNQEIETQHQDIKDSIEYAKRIQSAMLAARDKILTSFSEHFILFKPKDIVSGDFYWFWAHDEKIVLSVIDCTGHGVPGAFMSMIGNDLLI